MPEQGSHEIQLTGKQLFFLFMSLLVLAVVVFLLGVSVGRGVRGAAITGASASASPSGAASTTAAVPTPSPNVLDYHERLQSPGQRQGQSQAAADPSKAAADPSKTAAAKTDLGKLDPPSPPAEVPPAAAAKAAGSKPGALAPPVPVTDGWAVQLGAFKSRDLAEKMATTLKGKGYAAFVVTSPQDSSYRVRVGPYAQHAEAVGVANRLAKEKEGYTPRVIR
jgi:cell division septation protein DedD